ncbi:MAG: GAF and ANTAR domain-containing protein [Propionibacteriaceae bacterium]
MPQHFSDDRFASIARSLGEQGSELETVEKALAVAVEIIDGCQHAGLSMVQNGRKILTPAATSDVALRGDQLQYELNEGPCLDSIVTQETVSCPDLLQEQRWPVWGPRVAAELGVRSMLCFQLFTTARSLGALNLYSESANAFDAEDLAVGLALAAHIAVALAASREIDSRDLAIVTRTVIGQAEGILMERYDLTADRAFSVLKRVSQETQAKLASVASELVRTRRIPQVFPEAVTPGATHRRGPQE